MLWFNHIQQRFPLWFTWRAALSQLTCRLLQLTMSSASLKRVLRTQRLMSNNRRFQPALLEPMEDSAEFIMWFTRSKPEVLLPVAAAAAADVKEAENSPPFVAITTQHGSITAAYIFLCEIQLLLVSVTEIRGVFLDTLSTDCMLKQARP